MDDITKGIRSWPKMIVLQLVFAFCLSLLFNYKQYTKGRAIELDVRSPYNKAVHYNKLSTAKGVFESGSEGVLMVEPQSFKEACMLRYVTSKSFNVLDFIYFLSIALLLWWMTYDIRKEDIFSAKVISGLRWIGFSIAFYGILKMFNHLLIDDFIRNYTEGAFGIQETVAPPYRLLLAALFFQLIPMFIQKARQIQREQNLTI